MVMSMLQVVIQILLISFSSDKDTVFKNVDVEYMKYSRSDTSLNLSTDIDMKTSTLKSNNFNTSTLNTKISFNDDIEYMKYENINVDNTFYGLKVLSSLYTMDVYPQSIRMPYNNKISFIDTDNTGDDYYNQNYINITIDGGIQRLNQVIMGNGEHRFYCGDIATASDGDLVMKMNNTRIDIYKPLYLNDVLFQQGGGGAFSEDVVIADTFQLKTDTISTNGLNDMIFNVESVGEFLRFQISDNTVRVPNTKSLLSQNLFTDIIKPLAISNDISFQGQNTTNDNYEEYMKINSTNKSIDFNKEIDASENVVMKKGKFLYFDETGDKIRYITSNERSSPSVQNHIDIVNMNTAQGRIRLLIGNTGSDEQFLVDNTIISCKRNLRAGAGLETNTIDTVGNANLSFQRSGTEYLRFDTTNDNITCSKEIVAGGGIKCNTLDSDGDSDVLFKRNDVQFLALDKFTEDSTEKEAIICSKQLRANANILVNNLQINQFSVGVQYCDFRLENADSVMRFYVGNSTNANFQITNTELTLGRVANCTAGLKSNFIDTYTDTDLIFRRKGVEYFRLDDLTGTDILNVANDKGVSASYVFGNRFWNRSFSSDTTFFGSNVAGDDRVEYMKWNYLSQSLDFNCPIDNTGLLITGNIVDTTVSDERLKTNIEDIECNFTECVKNVKVKTFEYTNEKYKDNDKYGFIAQELQKHLPKEFNHIVKENKEKDSDDKYLSINYMKVNLLLWGCCQEQQSKIEHLESRLFELEDIVKELKDNKKPTPKSKAKAKSKP